MRRRLVENLRLCPASGKLKKDCQKKRFISRSAGGRGFREGAEWGHPFLLEMAERQVDYRSTTR